MNDEHIKNPLSIVTMLDSEWDMESGRKKCRKEGHLGVSDEALGEPDGGRFV